VCIIHQCTLYIINYGTYKSFAKVNDTKDLDSNVFRKLPVRVKYSKFILSNAPLRMTDIWLLDRSLKR